MRQGSLMAVLNLHRLGSDRWQVFILHFGWTVFTYQYYNINCTIIDWIVDKGRGNLKLLCPSLWNSCKKWEKNYRSQHASTFTTENLTRLHSKFGEVSYPLAFYRVYSVIACSFAARSGEPRLLTFENFDQGIDANGRTFSQLNYTRNKQSSGVDETDTFCFIKGQAEVQAIQNWISFFNPAHRTGRFFRYVRLKKTENGEQQKR